MYYIIHAYVSGHVAVLELALVIMYKYKLNTN